MKLEIDYNIKDGQRTIISTNNDQYGYRTLLIPEELALKIFEALKEGTM